MVNKNGNVLGDRVPEKIAANIFIESTPKGQPISPFRHSMYRPMLYVDFKMLAQLMKRTH